MELDSLLNNANMPDLNCFAFHFCLQDKYEQENNTFQILIEGVPCCEKGVICTRNIKILLEVCILQSGIINLALCYMICLYFCHMTFDQFILYK